MTTTAMFQGRKGYQEFFMSKGTTGEPKSQDRKGCQKTSISKGATGRAEFRDKMGRLLQGRWLPWDSIWVVFCM